MTKSLARVGLLTALLALASRPAAADAALGGSPRSMSRQHGVAVQAAYAFLGSERELARLVAGGELVAVEGSADLAVSDGVQHRYARPEVRRFVERLAAQYHAATGERLVVTSLVRPEDEQPANASRLSVHPAGMAVDLRVSQKAASRAWLERTLLDLERQGVLDATREFRPPHYHVAVFPAAYTAWADARDAADAARAAQAAAERTSRAVAVAALAAPTPTTAVATAAASTPAVMTPDVDRDAARGGLLALVVGIGASTLAAAAAGVSRHRPVA